MTWDRFVTWGRAIGFIAIGIAFAQVLPPIGLVGILLLGVLFYLDERHAQ